MITTPAFWIAIALIAVILIIFLSLRFHYRGANKPWRKMQGLFTTIGFFLVALFLIDLVYYASFDLPQAIPDYKNGFILYDIIVAVLLLLYAISLGRFFYLRYKGPNFAQPKPSRISRIWNWDKALGGTTIADTANAVGVLGGVGAHAVFSNLDGWWWVGQFGGLMAIIVGISTYQRYLLEPVTATNDWWQKDRATVQPGSVLNVIVGVLTLFSLMLPSQSNSSHVIANDVGPTGLTFIELFWFILLPILLVIIVIQFVSDQYRPQRQGKAGKYAYGIALVSIFLITPIVLIVFHTTSTDGNYGETPAGDIFGILAGLAWIAAEFWSFILISVGWRKRWDIDVPKYLTWEKNMWQVTGALTIIVFLSAKINQGDNWQTVPLGWTIAFVIGASFAAFGTLRGIFLGLMNRFFKEREELRQQQQQAQLLQAIRHGDQQAQLRQQIRAGINLNPLPQQQVVVQAPHDGNQGGDNPNGN
jgi:hypothetical protein